MKKKMEPFLKRAIDKIGVYVKTRQSEELDYILQHEEMLVRTAIKNLREFANQNSRSKPGKFCLEQALYIEQELEIALKGGDK